MYVISVDTDIVMKKKGDNFYAKHNKISVTAELTGLADFELTSLLMETKNYVG